MNYLLIFVLIVALFIFSKLVKNFFLNIKTKLDEKSFEGIIETNNLTTEEKIRQDIFISKYRRGEANIKPINNDYE